MFLNLVGEFIGTTVLVLLGDGVIAGQLLKNSKAKEQNWASISIGWGIAITVAAVIASYMAPGHLNPAVTLAMMINGDTSLGLGIGFMIVQLLGAMFGALILYVFYYQFWDQEMPNDERLSIFSTVPAKRDNFFNFFNEMIGTFILVYVLFALSKAGMTGAGVPIVAGITVAGLVFSLGGPTGAALNPARDLGPRFIYSLLPFKNKNANWSYAWVPIVGPLVGGLLAALIFMLTK